MKPAIGTKVIWETKDPRGNFWPLIVQEGRVYDYKEHDRVVVNVSIYHKPKPSDLVSIWVGNLIW